MTVLSFDGNMIVYLKSRGYSDPLIAGMRGVNVVTGLLGTVLMPWGEKKFGLIRTGSWSIWSEAVFLVPTTVALFVGNQFGTGPAWSEVLLFGGMAFSRIGLWCFDLVQLALLQRAFDDEQHSSNKNALTSLQFALQNMGTLLMYVLVIILNKPDQFKYAGVVSGVFVLFGAILWLPYARRQRGHLFHAKNILNVFQFKKRR